MDEDDEDDFIEYQEGERPIRRRRADGVSAEMAEMLEEQEGIFGSASELQELLAFTKGLPDDSGAPEEEDEGYDEVGAACAVAGEGTGEGEPCRAERS